MLEGRHAMKRAMEETPMSEGLARKLDTLTDAEWNELTSWLTTRFISVMRKRGLVLARAEEDRHGD